MIHQVGPTLPRRQSAAKVINTVAGQLPLSAKRPAHPAMLISQGRVAKRPPRLAKEGRLSEPVPTLPDVRVRRTLADRVQAQLRHRTAQVLVVVAGSAGGQEPARPGAGWILQGLRARRDHRIGALALIVQRLWMHRLRRGASADAPQGVL